MTLYRFPMMFCYNIRGFIYTANIGCRFAMRILEPSEEYLKPLIEHSRLTI